MSGVTFAKQSVRVVIVILVGSVVFLLVVGVVLVFHCLSAKVVDSPVCVASVVCVMFVSGTVVLVVRVVCVWRVQPRT